MILFKCICILSSLLVIARSMPEQKAQHQDLKKYIVIFNETYHDRKLMSDAQKEGTVEQLGGTVNAWFHTVLNGMVVTLPSEHAAFLLERDERVAYITEDRFVDSPEPADEIVLIPSSSTLPWNLDRVDQEALPLDNSYEWYQDENAGDGVNVCIIDTGFDSDYLNSGEINFGGGVNFGGTNPNPTYDWDDCNGHGTHVAGTVGSRSYGIAPGVTIWVARVFPCSGGATFSSISSAVDWCAKKKVEEGGKWIINMSLGAGGSNEPLTTAINNARNSSIIVTVSAGNSNDDSCGRTPAGVLSAITVGATTSSDDRTWFSSFGPCVDIFAPGNSIQSLGRKNATESTKEATMSGTSMASPLIAGVAALFFQHYDTADDAEEAMLAAAVVDKVKNSNTANNRLAQILGLPLHAPSAPPSDAPSTHPSTHPTPFPTIPPTPVPTVPPPGVTTVPPPAPAPTRRQPTLRNKVREKN